MIKSNYRIFELTIRDKFIIGEVEITILNISQTTLDHKMINKQEKNVKISFNKGKENIKIDVTDIVKKEKIKLEDDENDVKVKYYNAALLRIESKTVDLQRELIQYILL